MKLYIRRSSTGYDGRHPPALGGTVADPPCPFCHLEPSITNLQLSWLTGSSSPSIATMVKRYKLYRKFWRVLRQLGAWTHPLYLI